MTGERTGVANFLFLAIGVLGVLFLFVYWASPQTNMGPIRTPQVNQKLYVGQTGYSTTIQSAVDYACRTGNQSFAVVIEPGMFPSDSPASVTGGCANTYIEDQRQILQRWTWNGSAYTLASPSSASGALTATSVNHIVNAASYPGPDCGAKIKAAGDANYTQPTIIEVNTDCGMTIASAVFMQPGHHIHFTQGGTWTIGSNSNPVPGLGSPGFYLNSGDEISGTEGVVLKVAPDATGSAINSGLFAITASVAYWNANALANATVHDLTLDGNDSAWFSKTNGYGNGLMYIMGPNDSVNDGPNNIHIYNVNFRNINAKGLQIGATLGNGHGAHDIYVDHVTFDGGYFSQIALQDNIQNINISDATFRNYVKKFPAIAGTATSGDGKNITATLASAPNPMFLSNNAPFVFVSGCSDTNYNVTQTVGVATVFDSISGTTLHYHVSGGAGASASGCQFVFQNSQAPLRQDLSPSSTYHAKYIKLDRLYMVNDNHATEYGIEQYGDYCYNCEVTNSTFDANGWNGGTGLSMGYKNGLISGNHWINGNNGQLGTGCECGGENNILSNNVVEGGTLLIASNLTSPNKANDTVTGNTFSGCQVNGYIITNNVDDFKITNNNITSSCASNATGIFVGWEAANVPFHNGLVANNVINAGGSLNAGITIGGTDTSSGLTISHNRIANAGTGITTGNKTDGSTFPTISNVTISKNDLSGATIPFQLGGINGVILDDNILPGSKVDTEAQSGLQAYDHFVLSTIQTIGTGTVVVTGGGSGTTWTYVCAGYDAAGNNTAPVTINVGNVATLDATHYHGINCPFFKGATRTKIWRTSGATQGKVADYNTPSAGYGETAASQSTRIDTTTPPGSASLATSITVNGSAGVSASGTGCNVTGITDGIVTAITNCTGGGGGGSIPNTNLLLKGNGSGGVLAGTPQSMGLTLIDSSSTSMYETNTYPIVTGSVLNNIVMGTGNAGSALAPGAASSGGQNNVIIGHAACPVATSMRESVCIGEEAGAHITGNGTGPDDMIGVYIGSLAAANLVNVGGAVVAIGQKALIQGTNLANTVAVGIHGASSVVTDNGGSYYGNAVLGGNSGFNTTNLSLFGFQAMSNAVTNSTLADDSCVGVNCLQNIDGTTGGGIQNTSLGSQSGKKVTTGSNNFFGGYGVGSGVNNITGARNFLAVNTAGNNLSSGSDNFLFDGGGYGITQGTSNIAFGPQSGGGITTGNYNIHLGQASGQNGSNTTGSVCAGVASCFAQTAVMTGIGQNAGRTATGSGGTFVGNGAGNGATISGNNVTAVGDSSCTSPTTGAGNECFGQGADIAATVASAAEIGSGQNTTSNTIAFNGTSFFNSSTKLHMGSGFQSNGTTFSVTGCGTATSLVGGSSAGKFVGASTTCNPVITMGGVTAPNGWACHANDFTTNITFRQTATTTTTATMTSSATAGATDTINFFCEAY